MSNKTRIVFTGYVADELMAAGEKFLHARPDLKDTNRNVFVFKNSESFDANLRAAIVLQLEEQGKEIY